MFYLIRLKPKRQKEINKCNITIFITIYSWLIFSNLMSDYQVLIRFAFLPDFMESKHFSKLAIIIIPSPNSSSRGFKTVFIWIFIFKYWLEHLLLILPMLLHQIRGIVHFVENHVVENHFVKNSIVENHFVKNHFVKSYIFDRKLPNFYY